MQGSLIVNLIAFSHHSRVGISTMQTTFPRWALGSWAAMSAVRSTVTAGVLVYIVKYLDVEKHFFIILVADNIFCLVMSLAVFINRLLMYHGLYNVTTCYFNYFFVGYTFMVGTISTALISVLRWILPKNNYVFSNCWSDDHCKITNQ